MLETTTRAQMATKSPSEQPTEATRETSSRRKSLIVITPSQILYGSYNDNVYQGTSNGTGTTTPLYEKNDDSSGCLETKNSNSGELPPFSFLKRPIEEINGCNGELKLMITSVIGGNKSRSQSRSTTPRQSQIGILCHQEQDSILPDDYDERIRFPQMSSHYIYENKPTTNRSESFETVAENKETLTMDALVESEYKPANFDLSQPTRRHSTPNGTNSLIDEIKLLEDFTHNNCIYENKYDRDANTLSCIHVPQVPGKNNTRLKNRLSFPKLHDKVSNQKLNQVYQWKKPLMMPAVLRAEPQQQPQQQPHQSPTLKDSESAFLTKSTAPVSSPPIMLTGKASLPKQQSIQPPPKNSNLNTSVYTIFTTDLQDLNIVKEPTHQHWQPNNAVNACMACLRPFHSPLVTMIYDVLKRHHCRFCGLIFCKLCLDFGNGVGESTIGSPSCTPTSSTSKSISSSISTSMIAIATNPQVNANPILTPLIDKNANFVIPVNTNRKSSNITSLAHNRKTCHKCTTLYKTLFTEINKPANIANLLNMNDAELNNTESPVVVIENPYRQDARMIDYDTTTSLNFKRLSICSPKRRGIRDSCVGVGQNECHEGERRMSVIGEVPTDWTWSSF